MRDKARIPRITSKLIQVWNEVPDWRLEQLIYNITAKHGDLFYLEDDIIDAALDEIIKQINEAQ